MPAHRRATELEEELRRRAHRAHVHRHLHVRSTHARACAHTRHLRRSRLAALGGIENRARRKGQCVAVEPLACRGGKAAPSDGCRGLFQGEGSRMMTISGQS
eukprot:3073926-Pleurochrysis_carterae.AAC.1